MTKTTNKSKRATQFGGDKSNKRGDAKHAVAMREFYRWLANASEDEYKAFINDKTKPIVQRQYAVKLLKKGSVKDLHDFTEQIAGKPKETIEFQNIPTINLSCIGGLPE